MQLLRSRVKAALSTDNRDRIAKLQSQRNLKLHLGCGTRHFDGWVNIDGFAGKAVDIVCDLRRPLPLPDACAELIYTEHFIEHLTHDEAIDRLRDCRRVLAVGGTIRIGVPDAELYMRKYVERDAGFFDSVRHLGNSSQPLHLRMMVVEQMARMGGAHWSMWDEESLADALIEAGFSNPRRSGSNASGNPFLRVDDPSHEFETLYMEADA